MPNKPAKKSPAKKIADTAQRRCGAIARPVPSKTPPFPRKKDVLTVKEFAEAWGVTETHIGNLIESGELMAINVSNRNSPRKNWRIPVEGYALFVAGRSSLEAVL
jgi:hypothetical protein